MGTIIIVAILVVVAVVAARSGMQLCLQDVLCPKKHDRGTGIGRIEGCRLVAG